MKLINDTLDRINQLNSSVFDNSNICASLLKTKENNQLFLEDPKNYNLEIQTLIKTIMNEVSMIKSLQLDVLRINFESIVDYNGKPYQVIELIKLKEAYRIKLDILTSYAKILEEIKNDIIQLEVQILISEYRKEFQNLNKILNKFNRKVVMNEE